MTLPKRETLVRLSIVALLIIVTCFAFAQILNNGFINYDDNGYVTKNNHIRSGISVETIIWSFESFEQSNWHPFTWISHAIDCSIFGLDARYHHAMNLLLHLLSSIILFYLLERITRSMWQSAFVAIVFAIHPLHVESVAWIAERKDVLSGLLWMMTIYAYIAYRQTPTTGKYLITLSIFVFGLLAKPMLVTLPFVLILLDYWPIKYLKLSTNKKGNNLSSLAQNIRDKIPFFLLSLISSIITYIVQQHGGSMAESDSLSFQDRVSNAIVSYTKYIWKTILPIDMAIFYPHPGSNVALLEICISTLILTIITTFVWKQRFQQPYLIVGWLLFIGMLIPVIGLVQVGLQAMADRYIYLPIIGLSIMTAWGVPTLIQRLQSSRYILTGLFLIVTVAMLLTTRVQVQYWKDSITLFNHALAVTSNNHLAHNNLGVELADSGKHTEAVAHLREALRIRPNEILIHSNLARSLVALGERREALDHYNWILNRVTEDPLLHRRIGDVLADEGRTNEAISHYIEAIKLDSTDLSSRYKLALLYTQQLKFDEGKNQCMFLLKFEPRNSKAHEVLGIIAGKQQLNEEAFKEFFEAIRYDSMNADAYNDLGILYERIGKSDEAFETFQKAVYINPQHFEAQSNLGSALVKKGQYPEAVVHWIRAFELNPTSVDVRSNLGKLYTIQGKIAEATEQFKEALHLDTNHVQVHYNYGNLLAKEGKFAEAEVHYSKATRIDPNFQPAQTALRQIHAMQKHPR